MSTSASYPGISGSIEALTLALEFRDSYTRSHCDRLVRLATELGCACDIVDYELDILRIAARFHDIGKIGVPDAVLLKQGRLTDEDWVVIKSHSEIGEKIFRATGIPDNESIAKTIRHHHEAFGGGGYPDGLKGEEIPILSRILLIVDAYDAMSTMRPYHDARSHEEVMSILNSEVGKKMDPHVFNKFGKLIEGSPSRASS
jgi:HD-GYP domain-containing protein (c-di-GMP phosphodiesterase class II)